MTRLIVLLATVSLFAACSSDPNNGATNNGGTNNGATNNGATNNGATNNGATNNGATNNGATNNGATNNGATNNGSADPVVVIENADDCYEFSNDVDVPLAIDGVFTAESPVWRRPADENAVCPASALLPDDAALTPYVAFKFCNTDSVEHVYDFEFVGQDGANGEPPLDDAYLVLYDGEQLPSDHTQCLFANDDIEGALDSGDSEILGVTVPAGGAITVIATTFTFAPDEQIGTGGYILVVSNAD